MRFSVRQGGAFVRQLAMNIAGLFLYALGLVLTLRSHLGLGPWDVLHQGITRHSPLTFGQASVLVGLVIIVAGLLIGIRPGLGTVLNMVLVGYFFDRILATGLVPVPQSWAARVLLDLVGIVVVGLGSGLYIRSALGAGPRDGLMLGLHRITKRRLALVRACLETVVAVTGFFMGGTAGIGTVIFALGIGPAVEMGFRVFRVPSQREVEPA